MVERYTQGARRVLFINRYEVAQLGGGSIEPDHILLGVLYEHYGVASRILDPVLVKQGDIYRAIFGLMREERSCRSLSKSPFSAPAKRVLWFAAEEADGTNCHHIGIEHLLLGLMDEDGSPAGALLASRGLSLPEPRLAVAAARQAQDTMDDLQ